MLENFLPRRKQMNSLVPPKCHILFNFKHSQGCNLRITLCFYQILLVCIMNRGVTSSQIQE